MEISNELLSAVVSGAFALVGVFVGAKMTKRDEIQKQKRERVLEVCSEFLSLVIPSVSQEHDATFYNALWIAESKIQLTCSKELSDLSLELASRMIDEETSSEEFGECLEKFVQSAKKELGN